jgi:hypothetical protein
MSETPVLLEKIRALIGEVRSRLEAGEQKWAIIRLLRLIQEGVTAPDVYRLLAFAWLKDGQLAPALDALRDARAQSTSAATELAFGRFLNAEHFKEAALNCFEFALKLEPDNEDALALICMHWTKLGQLERAIEFGQRSLEARDRQADPSAEPVGMARPRPFNPSSPQENIISFSLFGDNRYYSDCAIANAAMAYAVFPEWRCRFYCDPDVPEPVRRRLHNLRSQVLVFHRVSDNWDGLFWRFQAFDDPNVNVVMVRDVDSPFTVRERLAVDEWLASFYPFHVIRDHPYHCEPMMAGLWAGWTRLLPPITPLIQGFQEERDGRFSDQKFLRRQIWPRIRQAALVHDRCYDLGATRKPPEHPTEQFTHIGMSWPKPRRNAASK